MPICARRRVLHAESGSHSASPNRVVDHQEHDSTDRRWRIWGSRCSPGCRPRASTCSRGSMRTGWPRWTSCSAPRPSPWPGPRFESLVTQQAVASNRVWDAPTVKDLMARHYIDRWIEEPSLLEVQKGSPWICKTALPQLLLKAIAWAEAQAAQISSSGRSLDEGEMELGAGSWCGTARPRTGRAGRCSNTPGRPRAARGRAPDGSIGPGMSWPDPGSVYLHPSRLRNQRLLSHELRHVHQYEQTGSIAGFLPDYLQQIVLVGYADAPLEQDARAHEVADL